MAWFLGERVLVEVFGLAVVGWVAFLVFWVDVGCRGCYFVGMVIDCWSLGYFSLVECVVC